jgi:dipeptidyl aminopeptidase/acylaminoacyl peptidase
MVEPYLVHYPSKDGKWQISAVVYLPNNLERNGQSPAIVYVHGGPTSQTMNSFNRNVQYLVNQGYVVIAPNYRGSTGYGKEFMDANRFDMGGGDLADCVAATDWIKQTGYVDPKKLVIMGGSYGGYMTMMGMTKTRTSGRLAWPSCHSSTGSLRSKTKIPSYASMTLRRWAIPTIPRTSSSWRIARRPIT